MINSMLLGSSRNIFVMHKYKKQLSIVSGHCHYVPKEFSITLVHFKLDYSI